jgi:hypothetical protein
MLPRKRKLKSIRDPNVQGNWLRIHQPRFSLTLANSAHTRCGALTLINDRTSRAKSALGFYSGGGR